MWSVCTPKTGSQTTALPMCLSTVLYIEYEIHARTHEMMHKTSCSLLCVILCAKFVVVVSAIALCVRRIIDAMLCISVTQPHTQTRISQDQLRHIYITQIHWRNNHKQFQLPFRLQTRIKCCLFGNVPVRLSADRNRKHASNVCTKYMRDKKQHETNNQRQNRPKTAHAHRRTVLSVLRQQRMMMMMPPHREMSKFRTRSAV